MIHRSATMKKQQGVILLAFFFVLFAAGATVFLSSVNTTSIQARQFQDVRAGMEKAKAALIAYAVNYHKYGFDNDFDGFANDEGPGRLPCPDVDNNYFSESNDPALNRADLLGEVAAMIVACSDYVRGRLPLRMTSEAGNISNLIQNNYLAGNISNFIQNNNFTGLDQQLWYVVSPAFQEITTSDVNNDTLGDLFIDGDPDPYVAVIIYPGQALPGQNRTASPTTAANYLEQGNLAGTAFVNSHPADPDAFNDQVIGIKASELMLDELRDLDGNLITIINLARVTYRDYFNDNGFLPADVNTASNYAKNNGAGWFVDEGYMNTSFNNYTLNAWPSFQPNVSYTLDGCPGRVYFFFTAFPNNNYVLGSSC